MNYIFTKKLFFFIIVYLNDILVYTKDSGQLHVDLLH